MRIGAMLNRRWGIGAKHALFSSQGNWYHQLRDFPGALCDPDGYILFATERDFRECPYLQIKKDVNLDGCISRIPGYVRADPNLRYRG